MDQTRCGRVGRCARWVGQRLRVVLVGMVLLVTGARAAGPDSPAGSELPVLVTETPTRIRLHVLLPENVSPTSVDVELSGRTATVVAESAGDRRLRSRPIRLPASAIEEGAQATFEDDGSLTISLKRSRPADR